MSDKSYDRQLSLIFPVKHSTSEMFINGEIPSHKNGKSPPNRSSGAAGLGSAGRLMISEVDSLNNRLKILNAENDELLDKLSETKRARERREREFASEREVLQNQIDAAQSKYSESKKSHKDVKQKMLEYEELQMVVAELRKRLDESERGRMAAEQHEEETRRRVEYELTHRDAEEREIRKEMSDAEHHLENVRREYDVIVTELHGKIKRMTEKQTSDLNVISELKTINKNLIKKYSDKTGDATLTEDATERKELKRRVEIEFKGRQQALLDIERLKEELEQKSRDAAEEIARLSDLLLERERQLDEAERKLKEQGHDRADPSQMKRLDELLYTKENTLEDAMNRLKDPEAEHRILTLRSKVQELEQMLARKKSEHADEIERLKEGHGGKGEPFEIQLKRLSSTDATENISNSAELLEANRELEESIRVKDRELHLLRGCFESCQDDLENVKEELRMARNTSSERPSSADKALLKTIQSKDEELRIANEALEQSMKDLERISVSISDNVRSGNGDNSSAEIERLTNKVLKKSNRIKSLKDELKKRDDVEKVSVSSANETLTSNLAKLDACQNDLAACRKELEGCKQERDRYQTELNSSKIELELLKQKHNDRKNHEDDSTSKKELSEITERNGKLERALVRLKLENDDLKTGKENKTVDAMKRLVEEKESLIADLVKEVNKLRSALLSNAGIVGGKNPENDQISSSEKNRSNVAYDVLQNKYEDILSAHRKLLEETTGHRADSVRVKRRSSLSNVVESENVGGVRSELIHAMKKLESSEERIAQLERWLDEIYSDPEIGLAPLTARRSYVAGSGTIEPISLPELNQSSAAADKSYRSSKYGGKNKKSVVARAKPLWDPRPKKN